MNRAEHRAWLEALAAEDRRRRAEAVPEIARKEALLKDQRVRLEAARDAEGALETALEAAREGEDPDGE